MSILFQYILQTLKHYQNNFLYVRHFDRSQKKTDFVKYLRLMKARCEIVSRSFENSKNSLDVLTRNDVMETQHVKLCFYTHLHSKRKHDGRSLRAAWLRWWATFRPRIFPAKMNSHYEFIKFYNLNCYSMVKTWMNATFDSLSTLIIEIPKALIKNLVFDYSFERVLIENRDDVDLLCSIKRPIMSSTCRCYRI